MSLPTGNIGGVELQEEKEDELEKIRDRRKKIYSLLVNSKRNS